MLSKTLAKITALPINEGPFSAQFVLGSSLALMQKAYEPFYEFSGVTIKTLCFGVTCTHKTSGRHKIENLIAPEYVVQEFEDGSNHVDTHEEDRELCATLVDNHGLYAVEHLAFNQPICVLVAPYEVPKLVISPPDDVLVFVTPKSEVKAGYYQASGKYQSHIKQLRWAWWQDRPKEKSRVLFNKDASNRLNKCREYFEGRVSERRKKPVFDQLRTIAELLAIDRQVRASGKIVKTPTVGECDVIQAANICLVSLDCITGF